jgi:uncharacterized phage protein gp47/JayE
MPWSRPTLTQLRQLARTMFAARLKCADATLRRSNIAISSDVLAGMTNGEYGYLDYLIRQNFTDTAEGEYLLRKGAMFKMYPTAAIQAAGQAILTGTDSGEIPDQAILFQDANLNIYMTQGAATIAGGTATVPIEAVAGGAAQNLATGAPLNLLVALANVNAAATVAAPGLTGGADEEDIEAFRARVLARQAEPPQGGDAFDYIGWAKTVPGVTRAWLYPRNRGGGTIDVTFVMDGRESIIPLDADVAVVQAAIDAVRPVTDDCVVFAPVGSPVNFAISGIADANIQAAITASVEDMFTADAVPGGAYDPNTQSTLVGGLSYQDQIDPAVAAGAAGVPFDLTAPVADIAGVKGNLLVPGSFTFT